MNPAQALENDLLAGHADAMSPAVTRAWNMGAWAYYTADDSSPAKTAHVGDFVKAWARFQNMLPALSELFSCWIQAGIDVTLFKGFVMAQRVYPHPALRFFGDVDVYVRPEQIETALKSIPSGWSFSPCFHALHEVGYLRPADGSVAIDLHCSFFPVRGNRPDRLKRLTENLLSSRISIPCGSQSVKCLQLVDLAIIGLAVNHGWGGDNWRLKPHDYLDLHYLREHGVSEAELEYRAQSLGLRQTWKTYARLCNPYRSVLQFEKTRRSSYTRFVNDLRITKEMGVLPLPVRRLIRIPKLALDIATALPTLLSVIKDTKRTADVSSVVIPESWPAKIITQHNFVPRTVRWAMLLLSPLLRHHPSTSGVVRSITTYRLLTMQGHPAGWTIGRRKVSGETPEFHSWATLNGQPIVGFEDELLATNYQPIFSIPAPAVWQT